MRKELLFAASCLLALGSCQTSTQTNRLKGVVTDATMNTVTVVGEKGDTLSFSTVNANREELDGLFIGDTLEISYKGEYKQGMEALTLATMAKMPN